eukprot:2997734-Amphidinium_carterae.1
MELWFATPTDVASADLEALKLTSCKQGLLCSKHFLDAPTNHHASQPEKPTSIGSSRLDFFASVYFAFLADTSDSSK